MQIKCISSAHYASSRRTETLSLLTFSNDDAEQWSFLFWPATQTAGDKVSKQTFLERLIKLRFNTETLSNFNTYLSDVAAQSEKERTNTTASKSLWLEFLLRSEFMVNYLTSSEAEMLSVSLFTWLTMGFISSDYRQLTSLEISIRLTKAERDWIPISLSKVWHLISLIPPLLSLARESFRKTCESLCGLRLFVNVRSAPPKR